ncbi:MAG TPA: hypothetical protein VOA41_19590 [Candidatus Dormibacteraeota bacterium]|nr:hypothetical protein [Candidatus Dormibacteraeota bacterium]
MRWLLLLVAAFSITASAAQINGNWKASIKTSNATFENRFVFKTDGHELTGTVQSGNGPELPISEGQIDGDNISFTAVQHSGDHDFKMKYTGRVNGNAIKLALKFPIGSRTVEMIAKKVSK